MAFQEQEQGATFAAIEAIYRERFGAFRRVAYGILGDREASRDAVQDAFAQAVLHRGSFRGEGSVEGWLWRTVVNTARMCHRSGDRKPVSELDDAPVADEPASADARLRKAVAALPPHQKLTLFLHYYADLDYATIAEALDISAGTVAATLSSARASLRKSLQEAFR
jgi:RNA polymerase sigma-70 factor, ECF subfamily